MLISPFNIALFCVRNLFYSYIVINQESLKCVNKAPQSHPSTFYVAVTEGRNIAS